MKKAIIIGLSLMILLALAWGAFRIVLYGGVRGKITFTEIDNDEYIASIYSTNALGFPQNRLTSGDSSSPSWSPDGNNLVYNCEPETFAGNICIMNSDGSNQRQLTFATRQPEYRYPVWSPDSEKIVFEGDFYVGLTELFVIDSDGFGLTQLTDNGFISTNPTWSPDGEKIAFVMEDSDYTSEIYVVNVDGSEQVRITDHSTGNSRHPVWSKDGDYIFFVSDQTGNWDIYRVKADGSGLINLTNGPFQDRSPAISPDGQKIVYTVSHDEELSGDIYIMHIDGTGQRQLTNTPDFEWAPTWSPDGQHIAYLSGWSVYVMKADGRWQTRITLGRTITGLTWQS